MAFIKNKTDLLTKAANVDEPLSSFIENFNFIEPGVVALEILKPHLFDRTANLAPLVVLHGRCCWCNKNDILPPRKRYCSYDCKMSAWVWCNPQSPTAKGWMLLNRQGFSCACCGLSFEDEIRKKIKHWARMVSQGYYKWMKQKASLHFIAENLGHVFNADHKTAIFLGGQGLGLNNIRVLAIKCHEKKTVEERQKLS